MLSSGYGVAGCNCEYKPAVHSQLMVKKGTNRYVKEITQSNHITDLFILHCIHVLNYQNLIYMLEYEIKNHLR